MGVLIPLHWRGVREGALASIIGFCTVFFILFRALQIRHDFINRRAQIVLPGNDGGDLGIEFLDIDDLAGIFLRPIGGYRDVVVVFFNGFIVYQFSKMLDVRALGKGIQYPGAVFFAQLVFISATDKFGGGVNKEGFVALLAFFQHDDAGGDGRAEEQIGRQLDDGVEAFVIHQILTDLLLRAAAIQPSRRFNNRRRPAAGEPGRACAWYRPGRPYSSGLIHPPVKSAGR